MKEINRTEALTAYQNQKWVYVGTTQDDVIGMHIEHISTTQQHKTGKQLRGRHRLGEHLRRLAQHDLPKHCKVKYWLEA